VSPPAPARLSVLVVTYNCRAAVAESLPPLVAQLQPGDQLVVVDNASVDGTADAVSSAAPAAEVIRNDANVGFAPACNQAAEIAAGDLLLLLNPDALAAPGMCDAIRHPLEDGRGWAAWMGLVTADRGRTINTSGGVIHFTGIAWAGESGKPLAEAPAAPREVPFASGACLAVPRETWTREGGFSGEFFMYHEDVDLSLRLWLAGGRVGIEPRARVDHDYEFRKGAVKWRLLERNRWATIIRTYPGALLVLLAPALVATELALLPVSMAGGWSRQKILATLDTIRSFPRLLRERRKLQAARTIGAAEFAALLTPRLSSPYLGRAASSGPLNAVLSLYWALVRAALRAASTRR
jgi:N-acetylglucosaminyl-diphospho-decaprenol L-rhamnosyltransferase